MGDLRITEKGVPFMQAFPAFVYDDRRKWLRPIEKPLRRIEEIEQTLEALPIEKEGRRREMEAKGFFQLAELKKQLDAVPGMPAGNFNALMRHLASDELKDVRELMTKARSPNIKKSTQMASSGSFMSMSLEDDPVEEDSMFQLRALVRAKMDTLRPLADAYFGIDSKLFDRLRAEKAELIEQLRSPHPEPPMPEIVRIGRHR